MLFRSVPPGKGAPSDKKPNKNPPPSKKDQKTPPKFPFKKLIVVSDSHRSLVDYPKGVATAKNPAGYSLNQLTTIRICNLPISTAGQQEILSTSMVMDQAITLIDSMSFTSRNKRSPLQSSQSSTILSPFQDFVRSDVSYSQCSTRSRSITDLSAHLPPTMTDLLLILSPGLL